MVQLMSPIRHTNYFLVVVVVYTVTDWVEAFPTSNKCTSIVASRLLIQIISHLGVQAFHLIWQWLWICLSNNSMDHLCSEHFQKFLHSLLYSVLWERRESEWHLQNNLACFSLQLHKDWTSFLPLAFLKLSEVPYNPLILSPSELMYRHSLLPTHPSNLNPSKDSPTSLSNSLF